MRPEQRQRLAVLVDTAIVKVGLISDRLPLSSAVRGRGCAVHFVRHSLLGMRPCPASCVRLWTEPSSGCALLVIGAVPCSAVLGAVSTAVVQLDRSLCLSGRAVR